MKSNFISQVTKYYNKTTRDRQERLLNKRSLDESKSFCTCPPSGNQVDGLPLASRWPFSVERACVKLDVFFSSSDEVYDANVRVNIENPDSYDIEASI